MRSVLPLLVACLVGATAASEARADARSESAATQTIDKAGKDFATKKYAAGITKLQKALQGCAKKKCSDAVRARLSADLGALEFRKGDKKKATKTWSDATKLDANVLLDSPYDSPDVRQAFDAATGGAGKGAGGGASATGETATTAGATSAGESGASGGTSTTPSDATKGGEQPDEKKAEETPAAPTEGPGKEAGEKNGGEAAESKPAEAETAHAKPKRFWVGLAASIDFTHLPGGSNLCHLDPTTAFPANNFNYYCTNADGTDFPTRGDNGNQNTLLVPGKAGNVSDSFTTGNLRLMIAFDFAVVESLLLGVRAGLVLFDYPGGSPALAMGQTSNAAVKEGKASPFGRLHAEVRATYIVPLNKHPLSSAGIAPIVFVGGGLSEFDAHASDTVTLSTGQTGNVTIWRTDGPLFFLAGAGVRWAFIPSVAMTAAVRANFAVSAGFMPSFGPELGVQYGF